MLLRVIFMEKIVEKFWLFFNKIIVIRQAECSRCPLGKKNNGITIVHQVATLKQFIYFGRS